MNNRRLNVEPRHRHTCEWILNNDEYKRWVSGLQDLLWIKGKPGAGKSTVMSFLYGELAKTASQGRDEQPGINLDFFFNARGVELQHTFHGMLRSLVHQLVKQDDSTKQRVRVMFNEKAQSFGSSSKDWSWQTSELRSLLAEQVIVAAQRQPTTIFVDALDEAGENPARMMAEYFHELHEQAGIAQLPVKICISCRHYPIVSSKKKSLEVVVEKHNTRDILAFVHDKLCLDQVDSHDSTEYEAWQKLRSELVETAQGVFQWVYLVVPLVQKCINEGDSVQETHKMLRKIPGELGDVYTHILRNVISEQHRVLSFWLFQWVCFAARPLTVTEMRYALVIEDHDMIRTDERMKLRLGPLSGGLLEAVNITDSETLNVQVGHQSVSDFMFGEGLALLEALCSNATTIYPSSTSSHNHADIPLRCHARLYWACLRYLSTSDVCDHPYEEHEYWDSVLGKSILVQALPFVDYATIHIFHHAEKSELCRSGCPLEEAITLERIMPRWIKVYRIMDDVGHDRLVDGFRLIHAASRANMADMVQHLLQRGCDPDIQDDAGATALHYAAREGHDLTVFVLIQAGANANAVDRKGSTPLVYAAGQGRLSAVTWLLEHGAQIAFTTSIDGGPLYAAAFRGHTELVKFLVDAGADVNAQGGRYGNALQAASYNGHQQTLRMLLKEGADVNVQGGLHGNALYTASFKGHEQIARILLEVGADVNAQGGLYGNALQAASTTYQEQIVQMLLDTGADVNMQGGEYGNALQAASHRGSEQIVQMLIKAGARRSMWERFWTNVRLYLHTTLLWFAAIVIATMYDLFVRAVPDST